MIPHRTQPTNARTRRGVLKTVGVALSTGLTTTTTGCLSSLPPLGQKQTYGRVDVPPPDEPAYQSWLPAPAAFDNGDPHLTVTYTEPSLIAGDEPEEFIGRRALSKTNIDYFGIGYENYNAYLQCDFGTVIQADSEASTVTNTLTHSGYSSDGSYRGYDVFSRSDVSRRVAVRDGTVVWSSRRIHEHPDIEALIDTNAGDRQRYHEASPSFKRISASIGASRMVLVGPKFGGLTRRAELAAIGFRIVDDAVYQVINLLFPEDDVPTIEEVEREVREVEEWTNEAEVFDSELSDRLASIETRVPLQSRRERIPFTDPPQVTWGVSHDPDAQTLRIRHEAGESIDAELLWADLNPGSDSPEIVTPDGDLARESIAPGEDSSRIRTTETTHRSSRSLGAIETLWAENQRVSPGESDTISLDTASFPPSGQSIDLGEVTRVDVLLAKHRSDTISGVRRLFAYKLE